MGKYFWPVFISVAALSSGLTWHFGPMLGKKLPPSVRTRICNAVADLQNRVAIVKSDITGQKEEPASKNLQDNGADKSANMRAPVAKAVKSTAAKATVPVHSARNSTALQQHAVTAVQNAHDAHDAPAEELKYETVVARVEPAGAKWGVLSKVTQIKGLDGKKIGNVAGGRFFLIERFEMHSGDLMLIGNFTPKKLNQSVQVSAKDVICFTGMPDDLSEKQKSSLRMYYQLNGEADTLKQQLLVREAKKNPYTVKTAAALEKLNAKTAAVRNISKDDADANRKATYEIAQLRNAVAELNQKAKKWKADHASSFSNPERAPAYLKILKERDKYAKDIPGLAF